MRELLAGLIGVLIGSLLQFYLNRRASTESRYLELKSEAYSDYLNAVASVAFETTEGRESLAAAKARLCIFGDTSVLKKVATLERTGGHLSQPDSQKAFIDLVQEMRRRGVGVGDGPEADIRALIGF